MSHSFVAAKLLSRLPDWTVHGQKAAQSLVTTPFLALHVEETEPNEWMVGPRAPNLFIISPDKPNLPNSTFFTINDSINEESLTVIPPLPFQYPLYLSVTPRIWCKFPNTETFESLVKAEKYRLDPTSFERFLKAVRAAGPSFPGIRKTADEEEPPWNWETWSSDSHREAPGALLLRRHVPFFFDLVPFEAQPISLSTSVLDQIALYRQLYLDYTWQGCRSTLEYIESMRENIPLLVPFGRIPRSPPLILDRTRVLDPSVDAARPSIFELKSQPIPHDGDPQVSSNDQSDDSDDDEDGVTMKEANVVPIVKAENIKVVALDCDTIIDKDSPLREALSIIFPPSIHQFSVGELLRLYVEKEALLMDTENRESGIAIVKEVARYLNTTVSQSVVQEAFANCAKPTFYKDVLPAILSLTGNGYAIVALPNLIGCNLHDTIVQSQVPGVSFAIRDAANLDNVGIGENGASTWDTLFEFCKKSNPGISRNEILVVTPNLYAVAEPAALAGYPSMFLRRPGSRSLGFESIPTFSPTFTVEKMDEILPILLDPNSATPEKDPQEPVNYPPFRIRDCYQITSMLGMGSNWFVWNGVQLVTGTQVAIKFQLIRENIPSKLLYEAAIYAQLEGIKGLVKIRWVGRDHNAHVLVMDKLGPDLERLRRFCRGTLSLKTVLMLGEQMLTTIEEIHARGIIVRDIKPGNFALGLIDDYKCLYFLDMGMSKLYFDPTTGQHMPFRDRRGGIGTPRYASHNVHLGLEPSRRDDMEAIGILLLYLLHGRLPWQGIYAADIPSKLKDIGNMKRGKPMTDLLAHSPPCFAQFIEHCRYLAFEEKPDYGYLKELLRREMREHDWEYDWDYDWWVPGERGTLLPDEYKLEKEFIEPVRHRQNSL